jgi:hypothetical protein
VAKDFNTARIHFFSISFSRAAILETMKEYDDGRDYIQEFWKLAISSQIGMLDTLANALDSYPKETQASCLREMYKVNQNFFNMYVRTVEQAGDQSLELQSDALRRFSEALKTVRSRMGQSGMTSETQT